jgi:hypothetical protein
MPQPILDTVRPDVDAVVAAYSQKLSDTERVAKHSEEPVITAVSFDAASHTAVNSFNP